MPFGNDSWQPGKINFCTPEQAMADYATLITFLKNNITGAANCPVVAFGGSYGGMLTTWFRLRYPNIVIGGLAASAPFNFENTNGMPFRSPNSYFDSASNTFSTSYEGCGPLVEQAFSELNNLSMTPAGLNTFTEEFHLCEPLENYDDAQTVIEWITSGLSGMAMLDYPYATNYGISLPAWPVNTTCQILVENTPKVGIVRAFALAIGVIYNNTGNWTCYNYTIDIPNWGGCCGWDYLACTEVYLPIGQSGIFPSYPWNFSADNDACMQQFGVSIRPEWPVIQWGALLNMTSADGSNIIFSNGLLDPWHSSGILESPSENLISIVIPEAGHHLDLRGPNPADPFYVTDARIQEQSIIEGWLNDYWNMTSRV